MESEDKNVFEANFDVSNVEDSTLSLYERSLLVVWRILRNCRFIGIHCNCGVFYHLGTSQELKQLQLAPSVLYANGGGDNDMEMCMDIKLKSKLKSFCDRYNLKSYLHSLLCTSNGHDTPLLFDTSLSKNICLFNSRLSLDVSDDREMTIRIGPYTVIENSFLHGSFSVGANCIVSGLQPVFSHNIVIPSGIMIQQVPLCRSWSTILNRKDSNLDEDVVNVSYCVLLTLGVNDDVKEVYSCGAATGVDEKSCGYFCGVPWQEFFQESSPHGPLINESDIWTDEVEKSLWTAQLFPVLPLGLVNTKSNSVLRQPLNYSRQGVLHLRNISTWFWNLCFSPSRNCHVELPESGRSREEVIELVKEWKLLRRLSLSELIKCGSAKDMAQWKRFLIGTFNALQSSTQMATTRISPISSGAMVPSRVLPSMKHISKEDCYKMYEIFNIVSMISEDTFANVASLFAAGGVMPSRIEIERESASICMSLLLARLCMSPSSSFSSFCRDNNDDLALIMLNALSCSQDQLCYPCDPSPANISSMRSILISVECIFTVASWDFEANEKDHSFSPIPPVNSSTSMMPVILDYFARMVEFYTPTVTLEQILRCFSGISRNRCILHSELIQPAQFPKLLLLLMNLSKFNIFFVKRVAPDMTTTKQDVLYDEILTSESIDGCIFSGSKEILGQVLDSLVLQNYRKSFDDESFTLRNTIEVWLQEMIRFQLKISTRYNIGRLISDEKYIKINRLRDDAKAPFQALPSATAAAPFRIDLAGGWSDTPPITYEYEGAVVNIAVDVLDYNSSHVNVNDTVTSLHCTATLLSDPVIRLTTRMKSADDFFENGAQSPNFVTESITCTSMDDFNFSSEHRADKSVDVWKKSGALLRACIVVIGIIDSPKESSIVSFSKQSSTTLADALKYNLYGHGLHITSSSAVPMGSGLGTSSILIAVVIQAIWKLLCKCRASYGQRTLERHDKDVFNSKAQLVDLVGQVEQLLRTGGGWQDQVGGIYDGIKVCRSSGSLPLSVSVNPIPLSKVVIQRLEERMCLVYSGVARVARNTLLQVLKTSHVPY